tara:strand:+ start:17 stop:235 length:219 start_codon:yes stop_codon:yes gene_type:complete
MSFGKIILLQDLIDSKLRKEQELEYYQNELDKLKQKMWWVQKEINLTNNIIDIIETEKVVDIRENMNRKLEK